MDSKHSSALLTKLLVSRLLFSFILVGICVIGVYIVFFGNQQAISHDPDYLNIVGAFRKAQPAAVNVSPNGKLLLTKTEINGGFKIVVTDRNSGMEIASSFSKCSQRALTWRPDNKAIAFQEISGQDRPLYILDLATGEKTPVGGPISQTAIPPIRWSPSGKRLAYYVGDWRSGRLLVLSLSQEDEAPLVIEPTLPSDCDFAWSPDGSRIAFTTRVRGELTIARLSDQQKVNVEVLKGIVRDLAWSPDGDCILVTARGDDAQRFRLYMVNLASNTVSLNADAPGDISEPVWMPDSKAFVYHSTSNGITRAFYKNTGNTFTNSIGPTNGILRVSHPDPSGESVFAHFSGLTAPPVLDEILLAPIGHTNLINLYSCPESKQCECPRPEFISIISYDGLSIPAYHWHGKQNGKSERSALIVVHGGDHTQTYPAWEAYLRLVTDWGCDVIAENHRGSSGYGRSFEENPGDPTEDIIAVYKYVTNVLKIPPKRIFLTGISRGSFLIANAASRGEKLGGTLLVSWPGGIAPGHPVRDASYPILEFHGGLDAVLSPFQAHRSLNNFFEEKGNHNSQIEYYTFRDEGHFFYRTESVAAVYWRLLKMIQFEALGPRS